MKQVKAETHYGQTVVLDQCPGCGGIWFDRLELFKTKQGEADKIDLLNAENLRTSTPLENHELLCSRDRVKLEHFRDPLFPKDIVLARCPACSGFWLNRGEFTRYQQYRQTLARPREITAKDEELARNMAQILSHYKTGDAMDTLGKIGKFLGTPIDQMTWSPLEPDKLSDTEKGVFDFIISTLVSILRLFIPV